MTRPSRAIVDQLGGGKGDVMCLGVGGKMGPTLAVLAENAIKQANSGRTVFGVSRFSDDGAAQRLQSSGVKTIQCDLLDRTAVDNLPDATDVIFMAGRKFGSTGAEGLTWALNAYMPGIVPSAIEMPGLSYFRRATFIPFSPITSAGAPSRPIRRPSASTPSLVLAASAYSSISRKRLARAFASCG